MVGVPRWVRRLAWLSLCVFVVVAIAAGAVNWTVRRSFPQTEGRVVVDGLDAEVTVLRDEFGIPQVYADTSHDLFLAQGYVQAQDRFYEMDVNRHITAGRLTEMFGRDALDNDKFVRTLGWRRVAEQELALLSTDTRGHLEAFADGVNAYLTERQGSRLSLEYAVLRVGGLDYAPEPWVPADSLAWLKAMAWDLGGNADEEIDRSLASATLSRAEIEQLYPAYPYADHPPVVTQGAIVDGVYEQDATKGGTRLPRRPPFRLAPADGSFAGTSHPRQHLTLGARDALREAASATDRLSALLGTGAGLGSNAWAVSGTHTASGAPILANDPHLGASMPGAWYQMGLHCTAVNADCPFDVTGFTFAGLPGVVIGHNADIAWGFTNLNPDVQDLYLERLTGPEHYRYDGRRARLGTREEAFIIPGEADPLTITVRESRHGPLVSDVDDEFADAGASAPAAPPGSSRQYEYAVALRWTALVPSTTADALFGINAARNWDEFRDAAQQFAAPSQNLVYADVDGHVGYQTPGLIPVRRTGDGSWPVPGWDPAYEWDEEFVPFDALPSVLDPKGGYVVTANQAVTKPEYPYFLGESFDYGFRSQRIRHLLKQGSLTVNDMSAIQLDDFSELAKQLTPLLTAIDMPSRYYEQGRRVLSSWDRRYDADSAGAAYFNVTWSRILALTFHDQLPREAWPDGGSRWWQVVLNLVSKPQHEFWDDASTPDDRESRDDILERSLTQARDELTSLLARDPGEWQWGKLHTLDLRSATLGSSRSPVAFLFNRGGYELAGAGSVVNATSWDAAKEYSVTSVPSMRMVVALDDLDAARWINLTGASGHAYHSNYVDQTALWAHGGTLPWVFTKSAVESAMADRLVLASTRE